MTDAEVVVKGEIHSSEGDLAHERELLVEGVDNSILEGPEEEAKYGLFQQWYAFAMIITNHPFLRVFQTNSTVLEDITEAQGGEVKRRGSRCINSRELTRRHAIHCRGSFLDVDLFIRTLCAGGKAPRRRITPASQCARTAPPLTHSRVSAIDRKPRSRDGRVVAADGLRAYADRAPGSTP